VLEGLEKDAREARYASVVTQLERYVGRAYRISCILILSPWCTSL